MIRLLIDVNVDHDILRGLNLRLPNLDALTAQEVGLSKTPDPALLAWAAEQNRILLTHDLKTIPKFAYDRVRAALPMPGVWAVPDLLPVGQAIEELVFLLECSHPDDSENLVQYLPL
jgi:Domain of unknown function (DUF5615)